jgi:thymidine kinase
MCCGELASYSFRIAASQDKILLGETDSYEARCRPCFIEGMKEKSPPARIAARHETL